ncbi:MAG: putative membrane protein [Planctomycetota bacterium]|jgi:uncharacterized membrane protein
MSRQKRSKRSRLALLFLRGLVTVLPVVLTVFIFVTIFQFASTYVTRPVNNTIYWCLEGTALGWSTLAKLEIKPYDEGFIDIESLPLDLQTLGAQVGYQRSDNFNNQLALLRSDHEGFFRSSEELHINPEKLREAVEAKVHPLVGACLSLLVVITVGWTLSGFFGRRFLTTLEKALNAIPFVRSVYPYSKQLVEFFLSDEESQTEFDTVVAVPYPREGIWAIGFVTNTAPKTLNDTTGEQLVCVFIPSSPMPMTGYTIMLPAADLIPIPISVDEALRVTVSGGVLIPPAEQLDESARLEILAKARPRAA